MTSMRPEDREHHGRHRRCRIWPSTPTPVSEATPSAHRSSTSTTWRATTARSRRCATWTSTSATTRSPRSSARRAAARRTVLRCFNRMNDLIPRRPRRGHAHATTASTSTAPTSRPPRSAAASAWCSRSRTRSRSPSTTTSPSGHGSAGVKKQQRARRHRREVAARRGAVGRGQGPPEDVGARPVRRPAAAAVHRPGHRRRARGDPDGRAVLGARPDRHRAHRGPDAARSRRSTRS